jgi:hypothetical protein
MQLEAGTPEEAASVFVERVRTEQHAIEVEVLEDRGEDQWTRIGRRLVRLDEVGTKPE